MGGKRGWNRGGGGDSYAASSWPSKAQWAYWKGTWSPRNKSTELRYDQVELRHQPALETEREDAGSGKTAYLTAIQKAVTVARKQDVRLRKINEEKTARQKLWQQYVEDTKRKFAKQKREFEADMQRLESERQTTLEQGQMAEAAWEALWKGVEEAPSGATFLDEAMAAAMQGGMEVDMPAWDDWQYSGSAEMEQPELKPVQLHPPPPGLPDPTYTAMSPTAGNTRYAPYPVTSPTTARTMEPMMGATAAPGEHPRHPGQIDLSARRAPTSDQPQRKGVKDATRRPPSKPPPAPGLSEKLEAKRVETARVAMNPFRAPTGPGPSDPGPMPPEHGSNAEPAAGRIPILEDDGESSEALSSPWGIFVPDCPNTWQSMRRVDGFAAVVCDLTMVGVTREQAQDLFALLDFRQLAVPEQRLVTSQGWNHEAELPGPRNFFGTFFRVLTDARIVLILDLRKILQGITWRLIKRNCVSLRDIAASFHSQCPFMHKVQATSASNEGPRQDDDCVQESGQVIEVQFVLDPSLLPAAPDTGSSPGPRPDDPPPRADDNDPPAVGGPASTTGIGGSAPRRSRSPRGGSPPSQHSSERRSRSPRHSASISKRVVGTMWSPGLWQAAFAEGTRDNTSAADLLASLAATIADVTLYGRKTHKRSSADRPPNPPIAAGVTPSHQIEITKVSSVSSQLSWQPCAEVVEPLTQVLPVPFHRGDELNGARQSKLLSDPSPDGSRSDRTFAQAREATRRLGAPWPHPPFRWQALPPAPVDDADDEDMLEGSSLVDVTFVLLTPGYTLERVDLTMLIPQSLQDAVDLLQTCRQMDRRELFPQLVEVRPQMATGWGLFLALPEWMQHSIVVCFDLSLLDGRVFAEKVPAQVDLWTLLSLADLPFDSEVDVHVPDFHGPLPRGADCEVYMGCCIMFLPRGEQPLYLDLMRMLRSVDDWNTGPGIENVMLDNGYCVAAAAEYFLFRLLPQRSMYYRQDIAATARMHPSRLQLVPAAAHPDDVTIAGFNVRAALAAVPTRIAVLWDPEPERWTTGILDARPALLGWMPIQTRHPWLELAPLAVSLMQSAPPGHHVAFPAFPSHWTWIWFSQGQILTMTFVQTDANDEAAQASDDWVFDEHFPGPDHQGRRQPDEPDASREAQHMQDEHTAHPQPGRREQASLAAFGLITLLEESIASPTSNAYFLAATLLDTLEEHFQDGCSLTASGSHRALRLQEHLPPPMFAIDADTVQLPHDSGLLDRLFCPWPPTWILSPHWECAELPDSTRLSLQHMVPWNELFHPHCLDTVSFSVYTDGSADSKKNCSGYAAAVLAHTSTAASLVGVLAGQIDHNPCFPWPTEGAPALHAEHVAIAVALLWCLQMKGSLTVIQCTILFDCTAAGWSAEGSWPSTGHVGAIAHHLAMIAKATKGLEVTFQHVKGHSQNPWNDLVDHVAKKASRGESWPEPPYELCRELPRQDISWLAPEQDARAHHAIPLLDGALFWNSEVMHQVSLAPEHLVPTTAQHAAALQTEAKLFETSVATINIQSLKCKGKYIEEQLDARCINVAFLQETKIPSGTVTSQHYLRLHSPSASHWGVAVWIHRQHGILSIDGCPLKVDENDVAVLHESPRLLVLTITIGDIKLGVLSGHCPHATKPVERDEFLNALGPVLKRLKHVNLVLGGIDLNGRVPCNFDGVSGDLEFGEPDDTGWKFAPQLAEAGIWIPSLYSQLHCGDSATYYHPSGPAHRIDYIVLGGRAVIVKTRSEIDETFDNGSPQEDHKLLRSDVQGHLEATANIKRLHRVRYDRDKIMTEEGRAKLNQAFSSFQQPEWAVSPDQHCHALEEHLRQTLDESFSLPQGQKRASYIPDEVWQLRDRKLHFKKRVRHRAGLWNAILCRSFLHWKEQQDYGVCTLLAKQRFLYDLAAAAVKVITSVIRKTILAAKNAFLQRVATEGHQGAAKILQRVKRAGIGGAKNRPVSRPLPLLLHPQDGSAITTRQQRDQVWMLHFGKQEQGQAMPILEFLSEATRSCCDPTAVWTADLLPCYSDVEMVFRDIPRNKAAGLDNIPGEIFKAAPSEAARAVLPLFLKSMLSQHQPLQWRGGILYEAFKRSGLQSSVDNYRSLFVSNYLAKAYHRVIRNKAQAHCRDEMHALHLGSRKQAPVTFAAMFVLAHFRRCRRLGHNASVLYLDTSAAYYRIVRELAVGDIRNDDTVVHLFERFGLDSSDVQDLLSTIETGGMLAQAGVPDALRQVVKDVHLSTWFVSRFSDGSQVCSSLAGSRPGESWADLIYAYIYGRVLWKIHEYAIAEDLTFSIPYDATTGIFATRHCTDSLNATDATWADDSAFPLADANSRRLLQKTQRLCTLVLSFCEGHGMAPNLKPGKTSVMLRLFGPDSKRARREFFPNGAQKLHLPDLDVGVAVVEHYKHLGGYVDCKLSMRQEARYRVAQASSSYDAAKTLLLNSPKLDLKTRAALFESAVTPTFFNVGLWLPEGKAWDSLANDSIADRALVYGLLAIGACLLLSLVQAGPPLLWAMLQDERAWCAAVQADLEWFVQSDAADWPSVHAPAWPEWFHSLKTAPQRFRRHLRKKLRQSHEQQCWSDTALIGQWYCHRTLAEPRNPEVPHCMWKCLPCEKSFNTRAALSVHFFKVDWQRTFGLAQVVSVLDLAHTEVSELHADDPQDPWDAATAALILAALLEDFQSLLRDFDWSSALSRRHPGFGDSWFPEAWV
ncbi:hypothetical protein AK812_SmicGene1973 [Symbiodinium microadriaticum]|uniref:Uncharacterized protein n=1 Tax=Symbiodinium microadriaticum TaxID=2951 RepID=A0A1Q9F2V1_SYMMI|nr:hypothetical protein AK812_SmicGene1973 [Symbiodinium microadriaticum]